MPSAAITAPLLIVLILAAFGFVFTHLGSSPTYSGANASSAASAAAGAAGSAGASARTGGHGSAPSNDNLRGGLVGTPEFAIIESGTRYQAATLATQVRAQLDNRNAVTPATSHPNGAPASGTSVTALGGCVALLTDGVAPSLVDRASYDGTPAYIIAVPTRAWVVGLDCSARDLHEIASVSLKGLFGNLSALGSVDGYASPGERAWSDRRT